jgi:hypothetical protein
MPALDEALTQLSSSNPTYLDLSYQKIDHAGAAKLAKELKVSCAIMRLFLISLFWEHRNIGHFFNIDFSLSLNNQQINTSLTTLDLSWNEIGIEGATAIAKALKVRYSAFTCDC